MSNQFAKKFDYCLIIITISLLLRMLFISMHHLFVEEAYYWNYAMHLDFGYLDHPPMVALLIKISTSIFGTNEFGVRMSAMLCWCITAFFSFKLSNLIQANTGKYAVMLLSFLPFFVLQSLVITPDLPLMVAWSASLFYLYRALVKQERTAWYLVGLWIGLGLVSKYTIALLGLSTIVFMIAIPSARVFFKRKEPYLCALIALVIFSPVIYWNATHEWASFAFQSTRRLQAHAHFGLPSFIGVFILFLTPVGIIGFAKLFKNNAQLVHPLDQYTQRFMQIFVLIPLLAFALFSLRHSVKFNWIGPSLLCIIPWLSICLSNANMKLKQSWQITAFVLGFAYLFIFSSICFGPPKKELAHFMTKNIAWESLTTDLYGIASNLEKAHHKPVVIIPLDTYNIASELTFYQAKLQAEHKIQTVYQAVGADLFGMDSLMYRYWSTNVVLQNKTLLLVTNKRMMFDNPAIGEKTVAKSPILTIWSHTQGQKLPVEPYYYQVVELR